MSGRDTEPHTRELSLEWMEEALTSDEPGIEQPASQVSLEHFEVKHTDGITLSSKLLAGLISDSPVHQENHPKLTKDTC